MLDDARPGGGDRILRPTDKTYAWHKKGSEILNRLLERHPNHPGVAHYIIHSVDYPPLAELGLKAARAYAAIAPDSPHALHMPSHIFTRLGLWDDSIASNLASTKSAIAQTQRLHGGGGSFDQLHAIDYLVYAYFLGGINGLPPLPADYVEIKMDTDPELLPSRETGRGSGAELFLCEGDSALGTIKAARDATFQAAFPLKGKPPNVYGFTLSKARVKDEFDSIERIRMKDITYDLARESGFSGVKALLDVAKHGPGKNVYLVRFHYLAPGAWDTR